MAPKVWACTQEVFVSIRSIRLKWLIRLSEFSDKFSDVALGRLTESPTVVRLVSFVEVAQEPVDPHPRGVAKVAEDAGDEGESRRVDEQYSESEDVEEDPEGNEEEGHSDPH